MENGSNVIIEKYKFTETRVRIIRKVLPGFAVDEKNANGV
jgi:hypothetical protein